MFADKVRTSPVSNTARGDCPDVGGGITRHLIYPLNLKSLLKPNKINYSVKKITLFKKYLKPLKRIYFPLQQSSPARGRTRHLIYPLTPEYLLKPNKINHFV